MLTLVTALTQHRIQWMKRDLASAFSAIVSVEKAQDDDRVVVTVDVKALMRDDTFRFKIDNEVPVRGESLDASYLRHFKHAVTRHMQSDKNRCEQYAPLLATQIGRLDIQPLPR